ncbi:hypothetical protein [Streptacidiphilus sp. P02-A3a]|uniref:hypothetical protein n=1 Tax=Streptacidiphilus sp. P02-A3a TaxID=2704468 RepID=UPI0015F84C2D|nr:hypothetical protein [Streptacidiphilus sp. P02-A3a]QMU73121.1 hypothetical protein GXP74_37675 [Streptacidiphilus sp. P02-A3a]
MDGHRGELGNAEASERGDDAPCDAPVVLELDPDPCELRPVVAFVGVVDLEEELALGVEKSVFVGEAEPYGIELEGAFGVVDIEDLVRFGIDASILTPT